MAAGARARRPPVILLNGLAGCSLEARVVDAVSACTQKARARERWSTLYPHIACLVRYARFIRDIVPVCGANGHAQDRPGLSIRPTGFGTTDALASLGPFPYFRPLMAALEEAGYAARDLRSAPFDWRLSPFDLESRGYFSDLRRLIESACREGGGTPAILIGHSMGCNVAHCFLTLMEQSWKRQHIDRLIALSPPWAGGPAILMSMIGGYNFNLPLPPKLLWPIQAQAASGPWLAPQPSIWGATEIVQARSRAYTAHDLRQLWRDLGLSGALQYDAQLASMRLDELAAPMVDTYCVIGRKLRTAVRFEFEGRLRANRPMQPSRVFYEDGDGTVPLRSLQRAEEAWAGNGGRVLEYHVFDGTGHVSILHDPRVLDAVVSMVRHRVRPVRIRRDRSRAVKRLLGLFRL